LFSQQKTIGRLQRAARLSASWNSPSAAAPSPKKATATVSWPSVWAANAAPMASPKLPPTIAVAPRIPLRGSAMCIEPPRPRL
jgi:hypothetical protein